MNAACTWTWLIQLQTVIPKYPATKESIDCIPLGLSLAIWQTFI
jgi:hypothetical protein